jgi:hypothetical protein
MRGRRDELRRAASDAGRAALGNGVRREAGEGGEVVHGQLARDERVEQFQAARGEAFGLAVRERPIG